MKKLLSSVAAAAVLAFGGVTSANAGLLIDGITVPVGAVFSTISLFEGERLGGAVSNGNGAIDQAGEELVGIGIVNQIIDPSDNSIVWSNGDNNRKLTVVLSNFFAASFNFGSFGSTNAVDIGFLGGSVKIYSSNSGGFVAGGTQAAALAAASTGNVWLDLVGSPSGGLVGLNPITLKSTGLVVGGNPLTTVNTNVTGQGFLDVVGGLAADQFDTNTFGCLATDGAPCPDVADIKFTSSGQIAAITGTQQFGFRGTGEITSFVVPLPGTLALTGLALVCLGLTGRRNKAVKA